MDKKTTKLIVAVIAGIGIGWFLTSSGVLPPVSYITRVNPRGNTIYHAALFPR